MAEETKKTVEVNEYGEVINPISNIITTKQHKVKKLEIVDETVAIEEVKTGAGAIGTDSGGEATKTVVSTDKK